MWANPNCGARACLWTSKAYCRTAGFRTQNLEFAASYIASQEERGANSIHIGTGGTPFMKYLKKHRGESLNHLLSK